MGSGQGFELVNVIGYEAASAQDSDDDGTTPAKAPKRSTTVKPEPGEVKPAAKYTMAFDNPEEHGDTFFNFSEQFSAIGVFSSTDLEFPSNSIIL